MTIPEQFDGLLDNLRLENLDRLAERFKTITRQLNTDFRNFPSESDYSKLVGAIGRGTAIKTNTTVEMYIRLPGSLYDKYSSLESNGQLQILQDVKASIAKAYPESEITIEGYFVKVPFPEMTFSITPILRLNNMDYVCPDSSEQGKWLQTVQLSEVEAINEANHTHKRKVKDLARMAHAWRETWQVSFTHLLLDTLVVDFLDANAYEDVLPFNQLMAEFLKYLANQDPARESWSAFGSKNQVARSGPFETQALESLRIAERALAFEETGNLTEAAAEWKKIFGSYFPS